jgi:hypothetical protein
MGIGDWGLGIGDWGLGPMLILFILNKKTYKNKIEINNLYLLKIYINEL